jgi:hypothetical protein
MTNITFSKIREKGNNLLLKLFNVPRKMKRDAHLKLDKAQINFSSRDYTDLTLCKPVKKFAFVFICQAGNLEFGALLLTASLKRFLKCEYELIAAIPSPTSIMGKPNDLTLKILEGMGVRLINIQNEIVSEDHRSKRHLITNKMYCFKIPTSADKIIFIDSTTIWKKPFIGDSRLSIPLNIRKAALQDNFSVNGKWQKLFDGLGVEMPPIRIRTEYPEGIGYSPPSFNSGFIAIRTDSARDFADYWIESWKTLDEKGLVKFDPYHIGQYALTIAVHKLNIVYEIVERDWVYDHYFKYRTPNQIQDNQDIADLAKSLVNEYPEMSKVFKDDWRFLYNS